MNESHFLPDVKLCRAMGVGLSAIPVGKGAEIAMRMALKKAGMEPCDIDYINAHGTSTMADTNELAAAKRVFGDDLCGAVT